MSLNETNRTCCVCKKLFCCVECRTRHETQKHPDRVLNCPLCLSERLPLRIFEDKELLCHIILHHLPLHCCLCGEVFKQGKDLETFGTCRWWHTRYYHSLISGRKSCLVTPSPVPVVPEVKPKGQSSIDGDLNGNFGTFTSPPEFYRNTSTPMHVGGIGQTGSFEFKTPNLPDFTLKTPKTNSASLAKSQIRGSQISTSYYKENISESNYVSFSSCNSHQEETPFRSAALTLSGKEDQFLRSNSGRKLGIMKKQEETYNELQKKNDQNVSADMELTGIEEGFIPDSRLLEVDENELHKTNNQNPGEDMELTGVEGGYVRDSQHLEIDEKPEKRVDSVKRVRFSDQYENQLEPSRISVFNATDNEEYFEACDNIPEIQGSIQEMRENVLETSDVRIYRENEKNTEKENRSPENKPNTDFGHQRTTGSSRVVMMIVVENNSGEPPTDLGPLIDSSLKKLEKQTTNICTSMSDHSSHNSPRSSTTSITSVDSYYSVSSTEQYSSPTTSNHSSISMDSAASSSSGGILSAVAHVVKNALKNFSGAGSSRNIVREQILQRDDIVSTSAIEAAGTSGPLSTFPSSLLRRPSKRPRDTVENSSPPSRSIDTVVPVIESRSPVAKRHRGWYKIKGREPIARMRNNRLTSPRGVSSETQVFSQGSLSVGDTVLPLPTRAHQSTQTE